jgi:hypothetical protein
MQLQRAGLDTQLAQVALDQKGSTGDPLHFSAHLTHHGEMEDAPAVRS